MMAWCRSTDDDRAGPHCLHKVGVAVYVIRTTGSSAISPSCGERARVLMERGPSAGLCRGILPPPPD